MNENQIKFAFTQIKREEFSHLVGVLSHLVYWAVFGGFNALPIDPEHMEMLLRKVLEQLKTIEKGVMKEFLENPVLAAYDVTNINRGDKAGGLDAHGNIDKGKNEQPSRGDNIAARMSDVKKLNCEAIGKRLLQNFVMPLLIMTARMEIEIIFNMSYDKFFNNIGPSGNKQITSNISDTGEVLDHPAHILQAQRLMNGVITEILDPNIFYSRISFLESGKGAIDLKHDLSMGKKVGFQRYKLPSIAEKYYTRSCMVKQFFDESSEGRIRAKFSDNLETFKADLTTRQDRMRNHHKLK